MTINIHSLNFNMSNFGRPSFALFVQIQPNIWLNMFHRPLNNHNNPQHVGEKTLRVLTVEWGVRGRLWVCLQIQWFYKASLSSGVENLRECSTPTTWHLSHVIFFLLGLWILLVESLLSTGPTTSCLKIGGKVWINCWANDEGICGTSQATPGQLEIHWYAISSNVSDLCRMNRKFST